MLRLPEPETGQELDDAFDEHLSAALALNDAVHDGAVMVGRTSALERYRICGWSYRLFPAPTATGEEPNRGSAFNSCLAMSVVASIDRTYLISLGRVHRFEGGRLIKLLHHAAPLRPKTRACG